MKGVLKAPLRRWAKRYTNLYVIYVRRRCPRRKVMMILCCWLPIIWNRKAPKSLNITCSYCDAISVVSLMEYLQALKHLNTCNFGKCKHCSTLEENLRDQFISGLVVDSKHNNLQTSVIILY